MQRYAGHMQLPKGGVQGVSWVHDLNTHLADHTKQSASVRRRDVHRRDD